MDLHDTALPIAGVAAVCAVVVAGIAYARYRNFKLPAIAEEPQISNLNSTVVHILPPPSSGTGAHASLPPLLPIRNAAPRGPDSSSSLGSAGPLSAGTDATSATSISSSEAYTPWTTRMEITTPTMTGHVVPETRPASAGGGETPSKKRAKMLLGLVGRSI
ncbi:hypothetical protein BC830DRAFT_1120891 [Chytriomyces sp. MP71]|nr:hypothetical protein BC830DRAFT_1120891 [Chytriomyces sp. MP71]